MGLSCGDVFIQRNIANMGPGIDLNVIYAVEYAASHLKENRLVVCGHYACGGVKATMQSEDLGVLKCWLRNIIDVCKMHRDELNTIEDEEKSTTDL